jgi:hypothetical protein
MAYLAGWNYFTAVTVDNTASTSSLSYYQVPVMFSGPVYASWAAHGKPDGSDLRVADSNGLTLLQFALEGIDAANQVVYLLVKVPFVAAGARKTIYIYWGNPSATSVSNYATTVGNTVAITGPNTVFGQSDAAGYNNLPQVLVLKNQTGSNASHNGDVLLFVSNGIDNQSTSSKVYVCRSTDGGVTYGTKTLVLTPAANNQAVVRCAGEMSDGTIIICYNYDLNTNAGHCNHYVASSSDAGQTWKNLSTSPTNVLAGFTWSTATTAAAYGKIQEQYPGGPRFLCLYGTASGDPGPKILLMQCPAGSDPTNGSNWSVRGTIATLGSAGVIGECDIISTSDQNHWIAVWRQHQGNGDLYRAASTDGGVTWGTAAAVGIPISGTPAATYIPVSPFLFKLPSGNIALFYGSRCGSAFATTVWGTTGRVSTDGGATFLDQPGFPALMTVPAQDTPYEYGYPTAAMRADGSLVLVCYEFGGTTTTINIRSIICDEDYLMNGVNVYSNCESFTATWPSGSRGAQATIDGTLKHNGTNSIKLNNNGGTGPYAAATLWPNYLSGAAAVRTAASAWVYDTACVAPQANQVYVIDGNTATPSFRTNIAVFNNTHIQWYNGAYQDTGVLSPVGQWVKHEERGTFTPGGGVACRIFKNNVDVGAAQTQYAAGGQPQLFRVQAGSTSGSNNCVRNIDDVYSHQYTPVTPAVTLGGEQQASNGVTSRRKQEGIIAAWARRRR